ncbi:hypothetical protein A5747_13425 [Mycobacterium sp. IS-836]|uniref:hypothetical protein n=1 Tax=Mycobacterium sp. IS-836 TaxID=1834160 RepID=UPI00096BF76F|nr:hypothetical protein [Mycobacterium sp. IS-836]OMC55388.1 hypothetical protein A5747_13425 [Mycobacterium sp. IS-836]
MTAMSELATELDLNWIETHDGYEHISGEYVMLWWNSNRENVSLYRMVRGELRLLDSGSVSDALAVVRWESGR